MKDIKQAVRGGERILIASERTPPLVTELVSVSLTRSPPGAPACRRR